MKDSFLNFEYNCEKILLEAITVQKKKGGQGLIETQYRSFFLIKLFVFTDKKLRIEFNGKYNLMDFIF